VGKADEKHSKTLRQFFTSTMVFVSTQKCPCIIAAPGRHRLFSLVVIYKYYFSFSSVPLPALEQMTRISYPHCNLSPCC